MENVRKGLGRALRVGQMDIFNVIAGAVSILAFFVALVEVIRGRSKEARHRERMAMQQQRNESALRSAILGAQNANLIVQRAKEADVTVAELASLARSIRGTLLYLASDLEGQSKVLSAWAFGRNLTISSPPESKDIPSREEASVNDPGTIDSTRGEGKE